jgi:hypothetical protein
LRWEEIFTPKPISGVDESCEGGDPSPASSVGSDFFSRWVGADENLAINAGVACLTRYSKFPEHRGANAKATLAVLALGMLAGSDPT